MAQKVAPSSSSQEVRTLDPIHGIRGKAVDASLKKSEAVRPGAAGSGPVRSSDDFGLFTWTALVKGHGTVKVTASEMGQKDPSQLKREICDEHIRLRDLKKAAPAALYELGLALTERFGYAKKSKAQVAREQVAEIEERLAALQRTLSSEEVA